MSKRLRSGYTTGACAAAAAKAAVLLLLEGKPRAEVEIPFPDGSRVSFRVQASGMVEGDGARAAIVKDAGDDPDVTNRAEIVAEFRLCSLPHPESQDLLLANGVWLALRGGAGVGRVTKPGLAVAVGEPAINPVPRLMIRAAVEEGLAAAAGLAESLATRVPSPALLFTISIPGGEELAKKTLNQRLGIIGGLSILGTTGIVRPVSAAAWTATIEASMSVARESGLKEIVLATGRTSEMAIQDFLALPEESYAMMGDYLEFSLRAARRLGFRRIHLAAMWAKMVKAALAIPQTHVRHGALEVRQTIELLAGFAGKEIGARLEGANTAREIYGRLVALERFDLIRAVCLAAKRFAEETAGLPVTVYLVQDHKRVVEHV